MSMTFEQQSMWNKLNGEPGNYYERSAESEREEFRGFIKGLLLERPVLVEFVKADGTTRVMNCTLSEAHGAIYKMEESKAQPVPVEQAHKLPRVNNDVCKIWDIDQQAWRSFRWDRLKRIQFTLG
jgi:hypothetical protein